VSQPHAPHRRSPGVIIPLQNLQDLALDDSEHSFYTPRGGDWAILGLVIITLGGTGFFAWHQLGMQGATGEHTGRAIFFGFVLVAIYWSAVLYAFKLSVGIRVGPSGLSVVRGPWHTELAWREVVRLVERSQMVDGQRLRWVLALARDGRRLQIREDMVDDYIRFRMEIYERYRLWRDHGGTWGTTGGGPFQARETISTQVTWWGVVAGLLILPGVYFFVLLPETGWLGPALLAAGILCTLLSLRALARRQTYQVDAKAIEASRLLGRAIRLPWREVTRMDRSRHPFNGAIKASIAVGRFALKLAMRNDKRMRSFDWYPRVPEYLSLRGGGHQIRINLHRVARPDELLAWVEFYERVGKRVSATEGQRKKSSASIPRVTHDPEAASVERAASSSPLDPWSNGLGGASADEFLSELPTVVTPSQPLHGEKSDAWLRDDIDVPLAVSSAEAAEAAMAAEDTPTQEVPASVFRSYFDQSEVAPFDATDQAIDDDLEDLPTVKVEAVSTNEPGRVTPRLGSRTISASLDEITVESPPAPYQDFSVPISNSLDQLWAPIQSASGGRALTNSVPSPQERSGLATDGTRGRDELGEETIPGLDQEEAGDPDTPESDNPDDLSELFAPWHATPDWQPPTLPRYGPPITPVEEDETEKQRHRSSFSEDEFLR
jgi:hypothetical protein